MSARSPKKSRLPVQPEAIHAALAPVQAYVAHMGNLTGKVFHAIKIPDGSAAHQMGYRFTSVPNEELAYYLSNGASLVQVVTP